MSAITALITWRRAAWRDVMAASRACRPVSRRWPLTATKMALNTPCARTGLTRKALAAISTTRSSRLGVSWPITATIGGDAAPDKRRQRAEIGIDEQDAGALEQRRRHGLDAGLEHA